MISPGASSLKSPMSQTFAGVSPSLSWSDLNSLSIRFGNTPPPANETPSMYELFRQEVVALQESNPAKGTPLNALRLEFFRTFKELAPAVLMVSQFRRALDRFPISVPSFMRWIPEGYVIKEFAKVGFDADELKAQMKKYDGLKGDKKFEPLITYCDALAKQNFKRFLNTDPAGNAPAVAGATPTPTLLQLLTQRMIELQATEPNRANTLTTQKTALYNALGDYGSIVLVFAQYRKAMKQFPLPVPSFVMNFVIKEFASCGFDETKLTQKIEQYDRMNGDTQFKELLEYCTQLGKANFKDFLRVPSEIQ
jgi:hypothetical protein